MISYLNTQIDSLSTDHSRGAAEIADDAASLFIGIGKLGIENSHNAVKLFSRAVRRLALGQPSMAPVLNLLNSTCLIKEKTDDRWEEFIDEFERFIANRKQMRTKILDSLDLIPKNGETVLTYSNSSTVANALIRSYEEFGYPQKALCGEGRPIMEGLILARKLKNADLDVTLYTDAALMSQVEHIDAVWIGGDSLSVNGMVNKIGSKALAYLCRFLEKPFISLATTDKLLPSELLPYFRFLPQNPREISSEFSDKIDIVNEYYETIPPEFITYVVTENGLEKPSDLISSIENEPVSRLLKELIQAEN